MRKTLKIEYQEFESWKELSDSEQSLVLKAYESCDKAYAPYSKFKVGASVLLEDGTVVLGNNQENIAYPSGLCAERVALFYAGANHPDVQIETLVIVAKGDLIDDEACLSPCGSCRQVIINICLRAILNRTFRF